MNTLDKRLVLLNPSDNIVVCCEDIAAKETINLGDVQVTVKENINLGHKLAYIDIKAGEKIIKYGSSIGSALKDIQQASHVHIHNIKSDYIPSHVRDGIVSNNKDNHVKNKK